MTTALQALAFSTKRRGISLRGGRVPARRGLGGDHDEDHERSMDHAHELVSIPPRMGIGKLMRQLKRKTAYKIMLEFPRVKKKCWGQQMWARGYFRRGTGNVADEMIAKCIASQTENWDDDFKVQG